MLHSNMSFYMMCWKFSCEQNFDSVPFCLPKLSASFPNRHRFTPGSAGALLCQETPSLRHTDIHIYHGIQTRKEFNSAAEIIAIKESYRHEEKKHSGGNFRTCSSLGFTK